jgi:hypothetical protein
MSGATQLYEQLQPSSGPCLGRRARCGHTREPMKVRFIVRASVLAVMFRP